MGMQTFLENIRKKAVKNEINKLISACENGEDILEALIVTPLSDLDTRKMNGWLRPDGIYYEDYVLSTEKNEISFLIENEDGSIASYESSVSRQIEIDKEYRDWQEPSGTLYEK